MQNLFITEEDVFEVKIYVAEDETGLLYCDINKKGVEDLLEKIEAEVNEYVITFKKPSFGDLSRLTDILMSPRKSGDDYLSYDTNPIAVKAKTISYLIRDWNLLDGEGMKIPFTEENILNLNPIIAAAIGIQLDSYLETSEKDRNKE